MITHDRCDSALELCLYIICFPFALFDIWYLAYTKGTRIMVGGNLAELVLPEEAIWLTWACKSYEWINNADIVKLSCSYIWKLRLTINLLWCTESNVNGRTYTPVLTKIPFCLELPEPFFILKIWNVYSLGTPKSVMWNDDQAKAAMRQSIKVGFSIKAVCEY